MSTTHTTTVDTETVRRARLQAVLGDYTIHTTGVPDETQPSAPVACSTNDAFLEDGAIDTTTEPHPRVEGVVSPQWWPQNWRNMPEYAPINRHLDREARPTGSNPIAQTLLTIVFSGCHIMTVYAFAWRNSFGKIHKRVDQIFTYEIGGEY